jgi:hypothetical protein
VALVGGCCGDGVLAVLVFFFFFFFNASGGFGVVGCLGVLTVETLGWIEY